MSLKDRILDFIFYIVMGITCSYALSCAVLEATVLEVADSALIWMCALFMTGLYLVFYNRVTTIVFAILVVFLGIVVAGILVFRIIQLPFLNGAIQFIDEHVKFAQNLLPYRETYDRVFGIAIAGMMSLAVAVNTRVRFNFYLLTLLGLGVMIAPVYLGYDQSQRAALLLLFCFLVFLSKKMNLFTLTKLKGKTKCNYAASFNAIPVCALLLLIAYHLPKPDVVSDSPNLQGSIIEAAEDLVSSFGTDKILSFSQEGSRLGGPIKTNDRFVMEVFAEEQLYLATETRDTYTGSSWTQSDRNQTKLSCDEHGLFHTSSYTQQMQEIQEYHMRFYGRNKKTVAINTHENRMRNIFTPPFHSTLKISEDVHVTRSTGGRLTTDKLMPANSYYTQEYISWDYNNRYFVNLLNGLPAAGNDGNDVGAYLDLPSKLPQRVRNLAVALTKNESSAYQKLKAIEAYLKRFPYTLEPTSVPAEADFVDYFLFTGQEGYCVYYATAMAVMGRCIGIPTRYAEGFVLPKTTNENGGYTVTNIQAHAWVEAYLDDFGWVRFEPTASYFVGENNADPQEYELILSSEEQTEEQTDLQPQLPEEQQNLSPSKKHSDKETVAADAPKIPAALIFGVATPMILVLLVIYLRRRILLYRSKNERLKTLSNRDASLAYFYSLIHAAKDMGYPKLQHETAYAYANRVGGDLFSEGAETMYHAADIYSRAAYSLQEISEEEKIQMSKAYHRLINKQRQTRSGQLKDLVNRYILHKY